MNEQILVIAGEKSGEEHAYSFLKRLKEQRPDLKFFGVGGEKLASLGMDVLYHYRDFSSMGVSEVLFKLKFYFKAFYHLVAEVEARGCQNLILIDFQDFNFRLAKKLSKKGARVFYYVAPQAWAWRAGRVNGLKKSVHTLFTILPFEKKWFTQRGVKNVQSVRHPLVKHFSEDLEKIVLKQWSPRFKEKVKVVLLPGSRYFEVKNLLGMFLKVARKLQENREVEVKVVKVAHLPAELYDEVMHYGGELVDERSISQTLIEGDICLAASGTVTLTCGLFGIPTIICYQADLFNEFIFYNLVKYKGYIGLSNVILGERVMPEYIQGQASVPIVYHHLLRLIDHPEEYNRAGAKLAKIKSELGQEKVDVAEYIEKNLLRD